ncbi:MAG: hypothetical protein LHV68_13430 [Elusimicrobia bacterium]|nr:hypothetical protein [Candidatus Liberimonas magnetica]
MIKKIFIILFLTVVLKVTVSAEGLLTGKNIKFSQEYDFLTSYVWRGFTLDENPVLQPNFYLSAHNFTAAFFSSWDTTHSDSLQSDEKDLSVNYTYEFVYFDASIGNIYYDFPGTRTYSAEYYLGLQLTGLPLTPNIMYYYDYLTRNGSYLSLDLVKSYSLDAKGFVKLSFGAHAGYNNQLIINGQGEDLSIIADLGFKLTDILGCSLVAAESIPFDGLGSSTDGNQESRFYAGVRVGAAY